MKIKPVGGEEEVDRERKDLKSVPNIDLPINGKFTTISQLRPSQNFKMRESLIGHGGHEDLSIKPKVIGSE